MAGLLGFTLADLASTVDARKRQAANLVRGLLSDPGMTLAQLAQMDAEQTQRDRATLGNSRSVMPEVRQQAQEQDLMNTANAGGLLGMIAYHGSPHKFDKFDMSKIGTGEGAQAYGHGLYFAESPGVAETYKRTLSQAEARDAAGNLVYSQPSPSAGVRGDPRRAVLSMLEIAQDSQSSAPFQFAAKRFRDDLKNPNLNDEGRAYVQKALDILGDWQEKGVRPVSSGTMYKVDIPDDAVAKMLDWDKPLSQQPEAVRNGLLAKLSEMSGQKVDEKWIDSFGGSGEKLYALMSAWTKHDPKATAAAMKSVGIPGIRYLDAGSRNQAQRWIAKHPQGGENVFNSEAQAAAFVKRNPEYKLLAPDISSNFVLFDDQLPKIVGRE